MKDTVLSLKGESSHHNISFPTSKLPALNIIFDNFGI